MTKTSSTRFKHAEHTSEQPVNTLAELRQSKAANNIFLTGAPLADMAAPTSWQSHSCRVFLTGLLKRSRTLERFKRNDGTNAYRLLLVGVPL